MIEPNVAQVAEFDAFEEQLFTLADSIMEKLFGDSKISKFAKFTIKSNNFINEMIGEFNEIIFAAMKDNGMIDSTLAKTLIDKYKPQLHNFISIPNHDFRLKEIAQSIYSLVFGGNI